MTPGEMLKLNITGTASDGRGIAKEDSFVIFVHDACEGDVVTAKIYTVHKTYATAGVVTFHKKSESRQEQFCPADSGCGGCPFSHMQYEKQLVVKKQTVTDALSRIGGFDLTDVAVSDTVGMERPFAYRNKMVFPVGIAGNKVVGGFFAPKSHSLIPLSACAVGETAAMQAMQCVARWMNKETIAPYDEKTRRGTLRRVFVRTGYHSRELMVVISSFTERVKNLDKLTDALRTENFDGYTLKSVILNVNNKANNLVLGEKNITLWGESVIYDTLMGLTFSISPHSFFQVNPVQTQVLYQTAIDLASLDKDKTVLDIYCGIGTISLYAARQAKRVIGVEIVESAIDDAKENAKRNEIDNATFYCGAAEEVVPKLIDSGDRPDVVILDPPRKGSDEKTLSAILEAMPERIVYVSCNPATLARDLKMLADKYYRLTKVVPVDMFPHTNHVECVALLTRIKADDYLTLEFNEDDLRKV